MTRPGLRYYCCACGEPNDLNYDIPLAPQLNQVQIACNNCGDKTHVLLTKCPKCEGALQYFHSDLDFMNEIRTLARTYVTLIGGIRDSLSEYISEFNVPLPRRWTVRLDCECGETYMAEIPLPQLDK